LSLENIHRALRRNGDSSARLNDTNEMSSLTRKRKKDDKIPFTPEVRMINNIF